MSWPPTRSTIFAIGRNYAAHAAELNNAVPTRPFWFLKPASSIVAPGGFHELPPGRAQSHHEVELGVVIAERARRVPATEAHKYIAGYCLALDMTDREGQDEVKKAGKPWTQVKGWDTSCPISDFIPAGQVPDSSNLTLSLAVNGEVRILGWQF